MFRIEGIGGKLLERPRLEETLYTARIIYIRQTSDCTTVFWLLETAWALFEFMFESVIYPVHKGKYFRNGRV